MAGNNTEISNAILDKRFGTKRHLSGRPEETADFTHAVKKEATELLLDSLDCLHETIAAQKKAKKINVTAVLALQHRLEGIVKMQRLLDINEAERKKCPDAETRVTGG